MKSFVLPLIAVLALATAGTAAAAGQPYTETQQAAYFPGQVPNQTWEVTFTVYHQENESPLTVYTAGTTALSTSNGLVKANAPFDQLASGYNASGDAPIYEVKVCLYEPFTLGAPPPIACIPNTFVGHTPAYLWDGFYGARRRG
jgi:hypothetical protein